ncbi:MAG: ATP-dependent metallopeptidase FtsH/Yme1/Tma family protein, partial [Paludibacter sp.]|nr:ATP-dependent metallopeptidase FtsH/Yme1/Tma family protein [Paludibacter sp.]
METNKGKQQFNKLNDKNQPPKFNYSWLYFGVIAILVFFMFSRNDSVGVKREKNFSEFEKYLNSGSIDNIVVYPSPPLSTIEAEIKKDSVEKILGKIENFNSDKGAFITVKIPTIDEFIKLTDQAKADEKFSGTITYKDRTKYWDLISMFLPIAVII